ncbi:MAG TPA: hypothetical protein VHG32_00300 [Thermoanaerobaculia bacterium]|nr:hypothetical protein [Thermoanaerobaculia bacterium]
MTPRERADSVTPRERADPVTPRERADSMTPRERGLGLALLAVAVALRLLGVWEYRFNSDEPQHAHVVWGWTRGLVQYRDFFDNHTPLFHMLWAPLLAAFGESVRSLFWLRLTMLPLYLAALAVTYLIGRRLLSARAALWGTVLTALLPPFFVKTLEFRTDVPWTLLWLAAFAVATGGGPGRLGGAVRSGRLGGGLGPGRLFATGLLVGAAAAVSLKSSLLLVCLLGAALAAALWPIALTSGEAGGRAAGLGEAGPPAPRAAPARGLIRGTATALAAAGAGLAGVAAVPAAVALYFQRHGALDALLAGAVWHNLQVSQHGPPPLKRAVILAIGVPLLLVIARWSLRAGPPAFARQRLLLAATTGSYLIAMQALWPLITSQTWLPVEPLVCLFVAAAATGGWRGKPAGETDPASPAPLLAHAAPTAPTVSAASGPAVPAAAATAAAGAGSAASGRPWSAGGRAFLALALAVELFIDVLHGPLRGDQTAPTTAIVEAALRLTGPGEAVFDDKGDAVFRRRAFFPVLEDITREAMARGRIADTIPEAVLANHVCVATLASRRLPPRGKQFLDANFLPVGPVRVCGKWLAETSPAAPPRAILFQVQIPGRYTILGSSGPARGRLDGQELTAPRELAAGVHVFEPRSPPPLALVWARAAERGFSPLPAPAGPARR